MIHQFTNIHPEAKIGKNVTIEAFTTIEKNVVIGDNCWVGPNAIISEGARIGKNCKIFPCACISGVPQDLKFEGEETLCVIGDNTTIRESVTISRGTKASGETRIGSNCLIMATAHIAHDCIIGNNVVIVNACGISGHTQIDDWAVIGGMSATHQFTKIGRHVMIAGGSMVRKDIPPFVLAAGEPISYMGLNLTGLRRRNFSTEKIKELQSIYYAVYQQGMNMAQALEFVENNFKPSEERDDILNFIKSSDRGVIKKTEKTEIE